MSTEIATENTFDITQAPKHIEKSETSTASTGFNRRIDRSGQLWQIKSGKDVLHEVNSPHIDAVLIADAPKISRSYYATDYVAGVSLPPDCWTSDSNGGPDESVVNPQASKCSVCPQNVKGSGSGGGKACRLFTRVAVGFLGDNEATNGVFQLHLPATSVFGDAPDAVNKPTRLPFLKYKKFVENNGYKISQLITRVSQDEKSAYKKLLFEPVGYVPEDSLEQVKGLIENPNTKEAIETKYSAAKADDEVSPAETFVAPAEPPKKRRKKSPPAEGKVTGLDEALADFNDKVDD
jgi:hypothetical protein